MNEPSGGSDWREANRAMWDERVPIHLRSDFYDVDSFRTSQDALRGFEIDEVGDAAGTPRAPLLFSLRAVR
jgi:hypothetical protein